MSILYQSDRVASVSIGEKFSWFIFSGIARDKKIINLIV